jgi:damage-control phosphatase, subfamily I
MNYTAPMFSATIQSIVEKHLGVANPYEGIKEENRTTAEQYLPYIRGLMDGSKDKLDVAIRAAIIGNIIDLGANPKFDVEREINRMTSNTIDLSMLPRFKNDLRRAESILYIGDNYEEALFDKFLLAELLPRKVVFAVRSKPVLNDITLEDARRIGIDAICTVLESGSTIAGTDLKECSQGFLQLFNNANILIAKGQGNCETLMDETRPIYFIFKIKCEVIAERSGYPVGHGVLLHSQHRKTRNRTDRS